MRGTGLPMDRVGPGPATGAGPLEKETVTVQAPAIDDVRPSPGAPTTHPDAGPNARVTAALQRSLTDLLGLALVAKHAHWNVTGPRFRALHLQLDELASAARDAADDVAERCVALGAPADGRPPSLSRTPEIGAGPLSDTEVIEHLLEHIELVIGHADAAVQDELSRDLVSQSIVLDLVAELDKQAWMLAAQR